MTVTDLRDQLQRTLGSAYSIERELGGGGMSRVFAAEERALGRKVVVKVLPPELSGAVSAERFRREIQLAAKLQHPHIVPLLSAGEADGLLYYTMPLVEGESLRARLAREGELPVGEAVRILRDAARALAYAHRHGVVHRDVKPENVLLGEDGALVTDFGVAKALGAAAAGEEQTLTSTGVALGTATYMAPEQVAADPHVDHRADVYALGVLAYELLSGQPPFTASSAQQVLAAHATRAPEPVASRRASVPPGLAALVMRCLEKRPADRPQSADEVLRELETLATAATVGSSGRGGHLRRVAAYAGIAALLGMAGYAVLARRPEASTAASPGPVKSVAVLPFANLSPDRENEYLADGMTEELINGLAKVSDLRVIARTSAFAFKGKDVDIREVARRLDVGGVVEGSVRRGGDRLLVSARLVDARSGASLWSETYQRDAKDALAVQEEIGGAIVAALKGTLVGGARPTATATRSPAAYDWYLHGRFFWNRGGRENVAKAKAYYERAIEKDPGFAAAYAGLADVYNHYYGLAMSVMRPKEAAPKARAAALKALALDSTLAEAHAALAYVTMYYDWDWPRADRQLRRAIELNPSYSRAHRRYAHSLVCVGLPDSAIAEAERGLALDPLDRASNFDLGVVLLQARRYDRALDHARRLAESDPDYELGYLLLGFVHEGRGMLREAAEAYRRVRGEQVAALLWTGQRDSALKLLAQREQDATRQFVPPYSLAVDYARAGEKDKAFEWLERAYAERVGWLITMHVDPRFDPLRSDPRFVRLLKRINLRT